MANQNNTTATTNTRNLWQQLTAPVRVAALTFETTMTTCASAAIVVNHAVEVGSLWAHEQLCQQETAINASPEARRWASLAHNV